MYIFIQLKLLLCKQYMPLDIYHLSDHEFPWILQLHKRVFEFSHFPLLLCCFIKIFTLVVALSLSLVVLVLNILENLCDLGKCLRISLRNIFPIIVLTFWLKGGLNQKIFLCILRFCFDELLLCNAFHRDQAFICGPSNGEFRQSFLTCRVQIRQSSNMSWFHINLKCNDWLREAMVLSAKWFFENIRNICSIFRCKKQLFQLISTFQAPNSSLAASLSWLA